MSFVAAPAYEAPINEIESRKSDSALGAQSLLQNLVPPPNYPARVGAVIAYLALIGAIVTIGFKANEAPVEEQQVIELAPLPVEEPPLEEQTPPPEPIALPDPPPPQALDPIAPVEEQKPVERPKPEQKIEKRVERVPAPHREPRPAPVARTQPAPRAAAPAVRAPAAPPGATLSGAANAYHSCLQRAAGNVDAPVGGRVTYHATVSATGAVTSFSITSSSNSALASLAQRIGGRCGSVPAPGHPGSLSGGISFSGP
ncbi:MAG: hypothetical protein WAK03_14130 [Methylocystis sp.]